MNSFSGVTYFNILRCQKCISLPIPINHQNILAIKQSKSGNGVSHRQWLYLYVNVPFIILVKVGISGDYKRRARQVTKSSFGWAIPVFAVKVPFAWQCEQGMHRMFRWFNIRYGGSKEWYLIMVAPMAIAIMLLAMVMEWVVLSLLVMGLLWWLQR